MIRVLLAPWVAVREARAEAERLLGRNHWLRMDIAALHRAIAALTIERDAARAKLAKRSAAVSRGNRTRALRRRGALLPDHRLQSPTCRETDQSAHERTNMTTTSFAKGATVTFLPGPRATTKVTGKVKDTVTSGEGRGRSTFLVVDCADGRERRIRPGSCQIAA